MNCFSIGGKVLSHPHDTLINLLPFIFRFVFFSEVVTIKSDFNKKRSSTFPEKAEIKIHLTVVAKITRVFQLLTSN